MSDVRNFGLHWPGVVTARCGICRKQITAEFVDGVTTPGPWHQMDVQCHSMFGKGYGAGLGQRYEKQINGRWLRVEG
jgi:hypothetical protein